MSQKFRSALKGMKDTYPSPNPEREAAFLRSLPAQESKKKRLPFLHTTKNKPLWYSVPAIVTAAVLITVGTGVYQRMGHHDLPSVEFPSETQTTTVDGQVYETQQTSASTEYHTNAPLPSDTEENVHISTTICTSINANNNIDVNTLQTDATEVPDTIYSLQTSDSKTTVPHQTVTSVVPTTIVSGTTSKATTELPSVIVTTSPTNCEPEPTDYITEPTDSPPMYVPIYSDYRVTPAQKYSIMGDVYEWNENSASPPSDSTNTAPSVQEESWQTLASKADVIVSVQIDALYYTLVDDEPYTQIDATVVGKYKGSLNWGDQISIYEEGGYVPVEVYQSLHPELESELTFMQGGTLFIQGKAWEQVNTNNVYLLFLNYAQDTVPDGAFIYTGDDNVSRCLKSSDQFTAMNSMFSVKPSELLQFISTSTRISVQMSDGTVNGTFSAQLLDLLMDVTLSVNLSDSFQ